jgi:hypothetical protein
VLCWIRACVFWSGLLSITSSFPFLHFFHLHLLFTTEEVVLQPVDVEMHSPPTSASSSTHETPTSAAAAAAAAANDSGLSTIQEIKKRLEEPRR